MMETKHNEKYPGRWAGQKAYFGFWWQLVWAEMTFQQSLDFVTNQPILMIMRVKTSIYIPNLKVYF
jgi:hypothetical protein